MEAVCEKIRYAPAFKVGNTFACPPRLVATWPCSWSKVTKRKRQAFEDIKLVLAAAVASLNDVVDLTTFHTDMRDMPFFMQVRDRYLNTRAGTI